MTTPGPRTRCRLPCTIMRGYRRIHARVLDVSEQGLCIVTPVRFDECSSVEVVIEAPRLGPVAVQGVVRHRRPFRQPSSGRRGWATGLELARADAKFTAIVHPELATRETQARAQGQDSPVEPDRDDESLQNGSAGSAQLFRLRLKEVASSRTRVLTLEAPSEKAVREAVLRDLPGCWEILGVEPRRLD